MKYLVHITASVEQGNAIESSGGPGPLFGWLVERLKPEAAWGTPTSRQVYMVVDYNDPSTIAETMLAVSKVCGKEPTFTPVYPLAEFGGIVQKAMQGLKTLPHIP
jgi:hypothetical protein